MSIRNPYSDIGPFKHVPEEVRSRVSSLASRASCRSLDEALRVADAVGGGGYELNAYRPSAAAVTAAWADEDKHVASVRKAFLCETLFVALLTSIFAIPSAISVFTWWFLGEHDFGAAIIFGVLAIALFVAMYIAGYRKTIRSRFEIRTQGFAGDALIDATVRTAGDTWLLGDETLVIAWANQSEASSTRAVFYDAIGTVTVTQESGLEGVTVTGRDGLAIARIVKPQGYQIVTAEGLAAEIRKRAEKARKAA